jgi:two-component system phosphate regulon response regulator PhoB
MQAVPAPSPISVASDAAVSTPLRAGKLVLVVSPESFVRDLLSVQLRSTGCFPMAVATAEEGRRLAAQMVPDLMVLDIETSHDVQACSALMKGTLPGDRAVRTVMLTSEIDQCCGPDRSRCGADLCVPKPFEPRELMRQLLRIMRPPKSEARRPRALAPLRAPAIQLDRDQSTVRLLRSGGWQTLRLPTTEHRLLAVLMADASRVHSREAIRDAVWSDSPVDLRTVDQYVRRLRRTLEAAGARDLVSTVKGLGYALDLQTLQRPPD